MSPESACRILVPKTPSDRLSLEIRPLCYERATTSASASSEPVVRVRPVHRDPDRARRRPHGEPAVEQRLVELLRPLVRDEEEVRERRQRLQPERAQPAASRSRSAIVSETSGGPASSPASASAAESVDTGAGCWRSFSSARDLRVGERVADRAPTRGRTPSRTSGRRSRRRRSAASPSRPPYSKYASSTTSGRAAGMSTIAPGRVVRPADERQHRVVVADVRARRPTRRRGRAGTTARPRSRSGRPARRTRARRASGGRRRPRRARRSPARRRCSRRSRAASSGKPPCRYDWIRSSASAIVSGRAVGGGSGGVLPSKRSTSSGAIPARAPRSPPPRAPSRRAGTAVRAAARCEPTAGCALRR